MWNIINFQLFTKKGKQTLKNMICKKKRRNMQPALPSLPKESPKPRFIPISPRPKSLSMLLVIAPRYSSEKIMQQINPFSSASVHGNPFRKILKLNWKDSKSHKYKKVHDFPTYLTCHIISPVPSCLSLFPRPICPPKTSTVPIPTFTYLPFGQLLQILPCYSLLPDHQTQFLWNKD